MITPTDYALIFCWAAGTITGAVLTHIYYNHFND
jgi:hypothetical protein